jgi:ribosomal protein S18 acetylase RimI-like enzyme
MKLRQATVQDSNTVVHLVKAMLQEMASYGGYALEEEAQVKSLLRARFIDSLEKEDHLYVVASLGGQGEELAGIVEASVVSPHSLFRPELRVHVHSLYVRPPYRRQGIGRRLLEEALDWGRVKGCRAATLHVLARNPARELYESLGFGVAELGMRLEL